MILKEVLAHHDQDEIYLLQYSDLGYKQDQTNFDSATKTPMSKSTISSPSN